MINVRELRIANLLYDLNGRIFAVTSEDFIGANSYSPIPITEEWLLKFGMIQESSWCGDDGYWYRSYAINETSELLGIDCNTVNRTFSFSYDHGGLGDNEVQIKYVHQLQNLYFALTGNELILKETE